MKKLRLSSLYLLAICVSFLFLAPPQTLHAQSRGLPDHFNVGWLGATAVVSKNKRSIPGAKGSYHLVILQHVSAKSVAQKMELQAGDTIFKVAGQALNLNPNAVADLLNKLEAAIAAKKKEVTVTYSRAGSIQKATLTLKKHKKRSHSESCPEKCDYCEMIIDKALANLRQNVNGGLIKSSPANPQSAITQASLCGLAFLATGKSSKYKNEIAICVDTIVAKVNGNLRQDNWAYSYATIFLCELYNQIPNPKYKKLIQSWLDKIIANQEASGGWAHGKPNTASYLELNVVTNLCLAAMGMAEQLGFEIPEDKVELAINYLKGSVKGGAVGYSQRQKGLGGPGLSAGAALGLLILSRQPQNDAFLKLIIDYYQKNIKGLSEGHGSPFVHLLNGALLSARLGKTAWKKYYLQHRSLLLSLQEDSGAFATFPHKESATDGMNYEKLPGPIWGSANVTLILLMQNPNLPLLLDKGNSKKKKSKKKKKKKKRRR